MNQIYLEEKLKRLPDQPGVYMFRSERGTILYVGKAMVLRDRVRSYFRSGEALTQKLQNLAAEIADIDFIVTNSEHEALILEANLIKEYRPYYNVRLKDDKSYPYIKVALNEEYPRVFLTRNYENDGGRYFGPFASAESVRRTLELLKRVFRYCSPRSPITADRPRPCFDYYLHRCVGACSGEISKEDYREIINHVIMFLEGKQERIIRDLKREMQKAADAMNFESAAVMRDQLEALENVSQGLQMAISGKGDEDAIALARDRDRACIGVFFVRGGKLIGREQFILDGTRDEEPEAILASFAQQFYGSAPYVPPVVLMQAEPEGRAVIESWLTSKRGRRVRVDAPVRGQKKKLIDMVAENASHTLEQLKIKWLSDTGKTAAAMKELQDALHLPALPHRMECYDVSNIQGTSAVGSMVVFEEGRPKSAAYRRFKIKTVEGANDYAMMQEVLRRRFKRAKEADASSWTAMPGLVLIDGGKGHLSASLEVMNELGAGVPVAAIAKEREELFLPGVEEPVVLPRNSQALYLVQRIRDEAHRFAITYHRSVRKRNAFKSALEIPGIGPKRRKALLKHFGSLQAIRNAPVEDLAAVPGMNRLAAERVKDNV